MIVAPGPIPVLFGAVAAGILTMPAVIGRFPPDISAGLVVIPIVVVAVVAVINPDLDRRTASVIVATLLRSSAKSHRACHGRNQR
jgi:Na+/glutamate symporter